MKGKIKIYQLNQNNKNKNNRVIYEALANKLRSSLQWRRHYIINIGFINIGLYAKNEQFFTYYLKKQTSVM